MIDYFALLDQPRKPIVDLAALKEKYHALARQNHPDHDLNEAYRVLVDPKLRLEHLLNLEGVPISAASDKIPDELVDLFMEIAPALNKIDMYGVERIDELLERVKTLQEQALADLEKHDLNWREHLVDIEKIYRRLSYLTRWSELLEERRFQLSTTP